MPFLDVREITRVQQVQESLGGIGRVKDQDMGRMELSGFSSWQPCGAANKSLGKYRAVLKGFVSEKYFKLFYRVFVF